MQTETIKIKYVNPPKGRGPGSVKDDKDRYWKVWPKELAQFTEGGVYTVGYKTEMYNDKEQYTITTVAPNAPPTSRSAAPKSSSRPAPEPMPQWANPNKDRDIFVCGAYNNALSNPSIEPFGVTTSDKLKFVTEQMEIWRLTLGRKSSNNIESGIPPKDDMEDEIPEAFR